MKSEDLLTRLMDLEVEAKEGGLDNDAIASAYELRMAALEEEDDASEGDEDE